MGDRTAMVVKEMLVIVPPVSCRKECERERNEKTKDLPLKKAINAYLSSCGALFKIDAHWDTLKSLETVLGMREKKEVFICL